MNHKRLVPILLGGLLVMGVTGAAGAKSSKKVMTEARAVWVARSNYKNEDEVRNLIQNLKSLNCNLVVFQVRGNGTVLYPSKYEPWAEEVGSKDPGWDPLAVAVDECHKQGMKIHAWVNVYPGWRTSGTHPSPEQMYNAHPEWFMVDKTGESRGAEYAYVSPGIPEVQEHIFNVFMEIVKNYDVDGLHYDYIRYPSANFSYDPVSIARFKQEFGKSPDELPEQWAQWRRDQITDLVRRVYIAAMKVKPNLVISAAVWASYSSGKQNYLQDSHQWLAEGIVDCSMPMTYINDRDIYRRYLLQHRRNGHDRHVYMGIGAFTMRDLPDLMVEQVELNRQYPESPGNVIFDYRSLYGAESATPLGKVLLEKCYQQTAPLPEMNYKPTTQIIIRPYPYDVQPVPAQVQAGKQFHIICKMRDLPADTQIRLAWINSLKAKPKYIPMQELTLEKNVYTTITPVPGQITDAAFQCQAQVVRPGIGKKKSAPEILGVSEWTPVSVHAPHIKYMISAEFGTPVEGRWGAVVAPDGKFWNIASRRLQVLNPNGKEGSFSPITTGLDFDGKETRVEPAGLTLDKNGVVYVTQGIRQPRPPSQSTTAQQQQAGERRGRGSSTGGILRFDAKDGKPLSTMKLKFMPSRIAVDSRGYMFILESGKDVFHILDSEGNELVGSPIIGKPGMQTNRDIAVSPDGTKVYIVNGSDLNVYIWKGKITEKGAVYKKSGILTLVSENSGLVKISPDGLIYVSDAAGESLKVFNEAGKRLGDIYGGSPKIKGVSAVAFSPNGTTLYLVQPNGTILKANKQ